MTKFGVVAAIVAMMVLCGAAFAGGVGPEAGIIGQLTFTPVGIDIPDAVSPFTTSSNPATLVNLANVGWDKAYEQDLGSLSFESGPTVTMDMETGIWCNGRDHFRVMRYGARSGSSDLPLVFGPGMPVRFQSDSVQLSYARDMGDWAWGASLIPVNKTDTSVAAGAIAMEAKSSFAGRLGATWNARPDLSFGAYWHYEKDQSEANVNPPLTTSTVTECGDYISNLQTIGALWTPKLGTCLTASFQHGRQFGPDVDLPTNLWFVGATQYLSPQWSIGGSYTGGSWAATVNYNGAKYNFGASYSPNALQPAKDVLGTANAVYVWAAGKF